MKINKIHVSGFGKITDTTYSATEFNQILSSNGNGKSTLANFLVVMFYGIESKKSSARAYLPWQNSTFGGNIEFEHNGKKYKVERQFGTKKGDDVFKLYDEKGDISNDFTSELGLQLFGVDENAFKRMCFFDQTLTEKDKAEGEQSIKERLESVITDTDSLHGFSKLEKKLAEDIKGIKNAHGGGKIKVVTDKISDLTHEKSALLESPRIYEELSQKIKGLKKESEDVHYNYEIVHKEYISKLQTSSPDTKAFELIEQTEREAKAEREKALRTLNGVIPTESDLEVCAQKIQHATKLREKQLKLSEKKNALQGENYILPQDEETQRVQKINESLKQKGKFPILSAILGALALLSLCLLATHVSPIVPILLFVCLLVGAVGYFVAENFAQRKTLQEKKDEVKAYLLKYANGISDFDNALQIISSAKEKQRARQKEIENNELEMADVQREIEDIKKYLDNYLGKYILPQHTYSEKLSELSTTLYTYNSATKKLEGALAKREQLTRTEQEESEKDEINKLKEKLDQISQKEREIKNQIDLAEQDKAVYKESVTKLSAINEKLESLDGELTTLQREMEVLTITLACLKEAKNNLTQGFLQPLSDALNEYCKELLPEYASGLSITEDLDVKCEINGIVRDFSTFSQGQQALIEFALRLGYIKAIFGKDLPFIVIDDAFAPLDKENLELAKKLLQKVKNELQIFYFTPHESRKF